MFVKRFVAALAVVLIAVGLPVLAPPEASAQAIVDFPVSFQVQNVNRTTSQCTADGHTYTIRGHLTAPASVLSRPNPAVTLYVHGTNTGEWIWRLDSPGHNYVRTLAEKGHASVTIDRLGYGSSPIPNGFATCSGAHADIADQIVRQLRAGTYTVDGAAPARFTRVFMAGHSSGALVAETAAFSFGNVDGIVLTGWAAIGLTEDTMRRFFSAYDRCLEGGESGYPPGFVHFDGSLDGFLAGGLGPDAEPRVREAITPLYPANPCGVMVSEPVGIMSDLTRIGEIKIPVHLIFGAKDVLRQGVESYPGLFTSSDDVTATTVPDAGHFVTLDVNSSVVTDGIADWLDRHQ
ncbi:alpha/beta hydrolase [Saccharopolyspora hattusasensis]|uniref:alpha/beta hydrolase n=1 Tax=Saccharopolyspora hattusasensis TaxID=1128679 RepID=UPI003D96937E